MDLALDAGNSALKGGLFDGDDLAATFRLALRPNEEPEAWAAALAPHLAGRRVERAGLASVVPAVTAHLRTVVPDLVGVAPLVIRHTLALPFRLAYETPETLGTDRIAAAAAAFARYGDEGRRGVVALDAGTAVTLEVVEAGGLYRGGVIGAGPHLVREALAGGTAQLPPVPLVLPPSAVGRSTREALQAGILYAFIDGVRGLLHRTAEALGAAPVVVATGGWSPFLAKHLDEIDDVDPHLVLRGIRVLMTLNG